MSARRALLSLLLLLPRAALAGDAEARTAFEEGRALYLKGEHAAARAPLIRAYELSGHRPSTVRALALVERALGNDAGALRLYQELLSLEATKEERAAAERAISELQQRQEARPSTAEGRHTAAPERETAEPDFLWDSRSTATPPAPEITAPPPPPPPPPQEQSDLTWWIVGAAVLAAAGAAVAVGIAVGGGSEEPYGGSLGRVLQR